MGLFKRGQVWWMSFSCRGRHYRRSTETENRKLAQRIHDKVKGEVAEGRWFERLPGEDKTFKEMMERYMTEHSIPKKVSWGRDKTSLKHLNPYFGSYLLTEINPPLINAYKVRRRNEGVKAATINRELAVMKKAFNLAVREWEWVRVNPANKVSLDPENNQRDRWLTVEEERELLEACPGWLKEIVIFALNTGMRLNEILSLEWKAVDLFRKTVTVFKTKNKQLRTIPINETTFEMLRGKAKVKSIKTNLVFYSEAHTKYSKHNVSRTFHKIAKRAGVEDFHFHDLRHSHATRLVQLGADLYKVQRLLGHKDPKMTQRYAHHWPESLRDAVLLLDSFTILAQSGNEEISEASKLLN